MKENNHSLLSPSGSSKWLNCPPSLRLEQRIPNVSSEAAQEGTLAHKYAESIFKKYIPIDVPAEMEAVMKPYLDFIMNQKGRKQFERKVTSPDKLYSGTVDVVITYGTLLHLVDLKYGIGVKVSAEDNSQLMLYALTLIKPTTTIVKITIYQPRLNHVDSVTYTPNQLKDWYKSYVLPRAQLALLGSGEFNTGDHCQFCRVKPTCRKHLEMTFVDPNRELPTLNNSELVDVYLKSKRFKEFLTAVDNEVLRLLLSGQSLPGLKLVEGRSSRQVAKQDELVAELVRKGFSEDEIYQERKLVTLPKLEAMLPDLSPYIIKPKGAPTVVPDTDKRAEWNEFAQND